MIHDYLLCNFDCSVIGEIGACNGERIAFILEIAKRIMIPNNQKQH